MRITNVIFDMDGTLIDTLKATVEACRRASDELGLPKLSKEALKDAMGLPGLSFFKKIMPLMDEALLKKYALKADIEEANMIRLLGKAVLFDGIEEMLKEIKALGIKLYIASTGSLEHVGTSLEVTDIRKYFSGVYCDNPDKAFSIGLIPGLKQDGEWIMVGDKRIDADAARSHGIFSVGAGFGYCGPGERDFFDKVVSSTGELVDFIRSS